MISFNEKTIQKSFTEQAKNFETKSMNFTKQEYLEHMVSCVAPQRSDTVLEVAAGTCICGRSLAPFVERVTCLDMTTAMLAVGKAEAAKQRFLNMDFVQGDAEKLPFSDNSFDIVISCLAFHHFPNPKRCFSEMARVLKTGGKLNSYLIGIDQQVENMYFRLVKQLEEKDNIKEKLKAENQMEWVGRMNNIWHRAKKS